MSGDKTVENKSSYEIEVSLKGRTNGTKAGTSDLRPVKATIAPGQSARIRFGDDRTPYLNGISVDATLLGTSIHAAFAVIWAGGRDSGPLDKLLNTHGTLIVSDDPKGYGFVLSGR